MSLKSVWIKINSKWRILLIILVPVIMLYTLSIMLSPSSTMANNGKVDLSGIDFNHNKLIALNGKWEFYWNKLLMPEDFNSGQKPQMDSFMGVPGIWSDNVGTHYTRQGFATYRLLLYYPFKLKDPALRIQNIANAYKLYVNGQLMSEVGSALNNKANFRNDDKIIIIDLPKDTQRINLVFQIGNLNCATGGLRVAPVFGSKRALEQQRMIMLILQMLFIGGVLIFGIYYFFQFLLHTKNKTALIFSIFCFITALRSLIWGETPLMILLPNASIGLRMYINYLTGYNYVAIVILFVYSLYPLEFNKKIMGLILFPSLIFDVFLLTNSTEFMTFYTNYLYIILLLQMLYTMGILMKSVLRKRENAVLMFIIICVLIWAMNEDIINFIFIGSINLSCMFLLGNFAVILAISYVQARQQAMNQNKLILYNEKLIEADSRNAYLYNNLKELVDERTRELQEEISVRKRAEKRLVEMANHDYLTNLPNRRMFYEILTHLIEMAKQNKINIAVLFVDLDGFKAINDKFGHDKGDLVLTMVAERLLNAMLSGDTVSRMGGDEFMLIMENLKSVVEIQTVCNRIIKSVGEEILIDDEGTLVTVTVSIGVAIMPFDGDNAEVLVANADKAMYVAKNNGKNQFVFTSKKYDL